MTTYPVTERNESVYIWHDIEGRAPHFEVPDIFADFDSGDTDPKTSADYYPQQRLYRTALAIHPQYVLENADLFGHRRRPPKDNRRSTAPG